MKRRCSSISSSSSEMNGARPQRPDALETMGPADTPGTDQWNKRDVAGGEAQKGQQDQKAFHGFSLFMLDAQKNERPPTLGQRAL